VFIVALAVVVAANGEALSAWLMLWAFGGLEYGFAILGVSAWLLWQARGQLHNAAVSPDWRGLWLVVPVGIATWLAYLLDVRIAQYVLFDAGLAALTWTLLGPAVIRVAAVPIAFFLLALPIWNYFEPALQAMTVRATALAFELTGTPAFVDETHIYTPHEEVLVLAQCSGAQYFQAGMTVGALYACTGFRSWSLRALVLAGFAAVAIAGNWIRVYVVILLGRLTEWQHFMVGWGIFALLLAVAFKAGTRLQRREAVLPHVEYVAARGTAACPTEFFIALSALAVVATLLLAAGPIADRWLTAPPRDRAAKIAPISVRAPWSGPFVPDRSWQPLFAGAQSQAQGFYHGPVGDVSGYWAWYARQGHRSQAVNQSNAVYGPPWEPRGGYAGVYYKRIPVANQHFLEVSETWLSNPQTGAQRLVWHWYCIAGRDVVQPWQAKFTQLAGMLHGRSDALVTVVSTDARDPGTAKAVLRDFVLTNFTTIHAPASAESP